MENVKCICLMRELMISIRDLEQQLIESAHCDLNQAMSLCVIAGESVSASEVSSRIGLLPAHTSKLLSAVEDRGWIERRLGREDKRKIFFTLTRKGEQKLAEIKSLNLTIPELLQPLFEGAEV
ncbi:MAG: winged helix DNA-binding protein [Porphyromonas sp.]|nr:winged helix DNA-binding protein [Porphyromonas sp.]